MEAETAMMEFIRRAADAEEFWFDEGCWIREWSNHPADPECSVAHARVPAGACTRWHRLAGTTERYVVLHGTGRVDIEDRTDDRTDDRIHNRDDVISERIGPGDVVVIPPGARQRVQAGDDDLVFLAICTPRFRPSAYEDVDSEP